MATTQQTQHDEQQTRRSLLFGMVIWFLHLNVIYGVASLACKWGWLSSSVAGVSALQLVETGITLVTIPVMLLLIYLPWRAWRRFQTQEPASNPRMLQDTEQDRRPLLACVVMGLNSLFLLFVVATFVPIFALNACGQS
jgi:hypothetical protein